MHCRVAVPANTDGHYRNHCPVCLWSLHVDDLPGDRASECRAPMEPIGLVEKSGKGWQVVHRCTRCGHRQPNRLVRDGAVPDDLDDSADLVLTDHHRSELGVILRDALATKARWIGIMGNPHHVGPHVAMLTELGVPAEEIARVHRPIGLNIGSRTPPEIALSALAGLLADRNGRPGGFHF